MKLIKFFVCALFFLFLILCQFSTAVYCKDKLDIPDKMEIIFDSSSNFIFSNISGAKISKAKLFLSVAHLEMETIDIMVSIESTDLTWRFNGVKLKQKDSKFYSDIFSIEWDGLDKNRKLVISGSYNVKIFVLDTKDNTLENNSHNFYVDNNLPDIRKIEMKPEGLSNIKLEAQIFDDTKIESVIFQFQNYKKGKQDELLLQSSAINEGEYSCIISSEAFPDRTLFEGVLIAKDKAANISAAKVSLFFAPEISIKANSDILYFNSEILPRQMQIQGTYTVGTLKTNINETYENTNNLEGSNWLKNMEIKNATTGKSINPALNENGEWNADLKDFLIQGDNQIEYCVIDYFSSVNNGKCSVIVNYDTELPLIKRAYIWPAGGQIIMTEMSEKVKLISNKTTFEVDLIKLNGSKITLSGFGRLVNDDRDIEVQPDKDFISKVEKGDNIIIRILNIIDIAGNTADKIESEKFVYDK